MAIRLHGMEWYNQLNGMVYPMELNNPINEWKSSIYGMEQFNQWNGRVQSMVWNAVELPINGLQ